MRLKKLLMVGAGALLLSGAALPSALADTTTQTIDASLASSVTLTLSDPNVSWTLAASGANTKGAGTLSVGSNSAYTVTVLAAKPTFTEWTGSAYGTKSLALPMSIVGALTSGTGTPAAGGAVNNTLPTAFASGLGLGTDVYSITLSQTTSLADPPLPAGSTYRHVLTYTGSAVI